MADDSPLMQVTTLEEAYDVFVLGVDSDYHDVKLRYHKLARQHHPDRTGATNCSTFQHINFAFQVITQNNDKEKRKRAEKEQRDAKWRAFRDELMNEELWFANIKAEAKEKAKERHKYHQKMKQDAKKQGAQETEMQKREGYRRL